MSIVDWLDFMEQQIEKVDADAIILPEYAWGRTPLREEDLEEIRERKFNCTLVAGTAVIDQEGKKTNRAIVITDEGKTVTVPKYSPMHHERERGIKGIFDPQIITTKGGLKLGVVICADLWHHSLVATYVNHGIDALMIPTMSVTLPGHGHYARTLWYSLSLTRSREFVLPIAVSDHPGGKNITTGFASAIVDPSKKSADLQSIEDFLDLPNEKGMAMATIDFDRIREYREYRIKEGLISQRLEEII